MHSYCSASGEVVNLFYAFLFFKFIESYKFNIARYVLPFQMINKTQDSEIKCGIKAWDNKTCNLSLPEAETGLLNYLPAVCKHSLC